MGPPSQLLFTQTPDARPEGLVPTEVALADTEIDLTNCACEPIHIPSAIRPRGMLLAARELDQRIVYASGNSEALLKLAPAAVLGRSIADLLGIQSAAAIESAAHDGAGITAVRFRIT